MNEYEEILKHHVAENLPNYGSNATQGKGSDRGCLSVPFAGSMRRRDLWTG